MLTAIKRAIEVHGVGGGPPATNGAKEELPL